MINEEFVKINEAPYIYAEELKKKKKIVGALCSYVPEEIIIAAGAVPFRLFGSVGKAGLANAHLQSYSCSLARGILEDALAERLSFLDGVVFAHTCDTMQRLSDIWRINVKDAFHLDVILPVKLNTQSARVYYRDVLQTFRDALGRELGTTITEEDLRRGIFLSNRIRRAFSRIYEITACSPGILKGEELYMLERAAMMMDRNHLAEFLEKTVDHLFGEADAKGSGTSAPKRVFIEGGICNSSAIYNMIEEAGGQVVGDDLCTGFRHFSGLVDETSPDPVGAIADRYIERIVCPAKHSGIISRGERLVEMARGKKVQGIVFFLLKFCDPHAFDYPYLHDAIEKSGIPSLILEVDDQFQEEGQLRTRIEAFMEMI